MARILVADDSPDIRMIVKERLEMDGHQVECAVDGTDALEKVQKYSYDLAVFDVLMPGHDGIALCGIVKATASLMRIPVLLMSAYSQDEKNLQKSNADAFLPKPFELSNLAKVVQHLLDKRIP